MRKPYLMFRLLLYPASYNKSTYFLLSLSIRSKRLSIIASSSVLETTGTSGSLPSLSVCASLSTGFSPIVSRMTSKAFVSPSCAFSIKAKQILSCVSPFARSNNKASLSFFLAFIFWFVIAAPFLPFAWRSAQVKSFLKFCSFIFTFPFS